jgi:hypothetical protein
MQVRILFSKACQRKHWVAEHKITCGSLETKYPQDSPVQSLNFELDIHFASLASEAGRTQAPSTRWILSKGPVMDIAPSVAPPCKSPSGTTPWLTKVILQLDINVRKKERLLKKLLHHMRAMQSEGHLDLAMDLQNMIHAEYGKFGRGCSESVPTAYLTHGESVRRRESMARCRLRWCREGYARCALHLGNYDTALSFSQKAYALCRVIEGSHKLVAHRHSAPRLDCQFSLLGLGEPSHAKCTLKDAVETMYRAMLH